MEQQLQLQKLGGGKGGVDAWKDKSVSVTPQNFPQNHHAFLEPPFCQISRRKIAER